MTNHKLGLQQTAAREYESLKQALFQGGLSDETLQVLLGNTSESSTHQASHNPEYAAPRNHGSWKDLSSTESHAEDTLSPDSNYDNHNSHGGHNHGRSQSFVSSEQGIDESSAGRSYQRPRASNNAQRTVILSNLPPSTSHKDITNIVRGGQLLDLHLRKDNTAAISFVDGAANYLDYVIQNRVEIHGCQIEAAWADRQFYMPDHVSAKLAHGATRNLVIRGAASKLSSAKIRDDMDHIHNLVVIDIAFRNEDVFMSLNSVHNALYARSCMMSRLPYKGSRIEFYPDECAEPITRTPMARKNISESPRPRPKSRPNPQPNTKVGAKTNIYALLEMDSSEGSSEDDDNQSVQATTAQLGGVSLDWQEANPTIIAA